MPGPFCFAWAGGTIQDQIAVVTNGNTHGALPVSTPIVASATAGGRQLENLASSSGLEAGTLYELSGPGVSPGNWFIYDDSVLNGFPGSLNLTAALGESLGSGNFDATKSTIIGVSLGTLTEGSPAVVFSDLALPAGLYAVSGVGIGETDAPAAIPPPGTIRTNPNAFMLIGTAFLAYDGAGGGSLEILAAWPQVDAQSHVTSYDIRTQEVRAIETGVFPLQIAGFPTQEDPHHVTAVPADALASLTPGLVYNITGNSLTVGTTFIAPSGGTVIDLALPAIGSTLNGILTISGPRTPDAPFDPAVHNRFDEEIIGLEITQDEGGFATLHADIKYNGVGLLAPGRNIWCWLSWDQAWTPGGTATPDLVPLFNGRLVGVPRLQAGEIVQLEFLARPDDFSAQKLAWVNQLAVLPYYDPVWALETVHANPDSVLETYSSLWHIDRVSLAVTVSDVIDGEAGTSDIGESQSIYENFSLSYQQPPLIAVNIAGTVEWQQQAVGVMDISDRLLGAFHVTGSSYSNPFPQIGGVNGITPEQFGHTILFGDRAVSPFTSLGGGGGLIQSFDQGIQASWPKPGTNIGGGWSFSSRSDYFGYPLNYVNNANVSQGGWIPDQSYTTSYNAQMPMPGGASDVSIMMNPSGTVNISYALNTFKFRLVLEYKADRKRTETITAVLAAGVQQELSDTAESDREAISLSSQIVGQGVDPNGALPIGDLAYRSYFQPQRGAQSFEYLLLLARAKMRARARSVDITFAVDWRTALGITLRHNIAYTDRRVPGGGAVGKVKSYRLSVKDGKMIGEFTIGCTIGTGESVPYQTGTSVYVDDGYVNPGYQRMAGAQLSLVSGDFGYETLDDFVVVDDGLNLTNLTENQVINICRVDNGVNSHIQAIEDARNALLFSHFPDPRTMTSQVTTTVILDLKPLQGSEFHTDFFPSVTPLVLPKTIDLSATSGG